MNLKHVFLISILALVGCGRDEQASTKSEVGWHHAGGSHFSEKYAPLDQINADNFNELEIAWRWQSIDSQLPPELAYPTGHYLTMIGIRIHDAVHVKRHGPIVAGGISQLRG